MFPNYFITIILCHRRSATRCHTEQVPQGSRAMWMCVAGLQTGRASNAGRRQGMPGSHGACDRLQILIYTMVN